MEDLEKELKNQKNPTNESQNIKIKIGNKVCSEDYLTIKENTIKL